MIVHEARKRPLSWNNLTSHVKRRWMIPFIAFEWVWQWIAFLLSNWSFLEVVGPQKRRHSDARTG